MSDFDLDTFRRIIREEVRAALAEQSKSPDEYLTIEEAARIAKVHHSTVRGWVKDGSLAAGGPPYRIRATDLAERLAHRHPPPATDLDQLAAQIVQKRRARRGG